MKLTTPQANGAASIGAASRPGHAHAAGVGHPGFDKPVTLAPEALLALAKSSLEDDKAEDFSVIDLRGKSVIGDYMLIASGRSARHVSVTCGKLVEKLKSDAGLTPKVEGAEQGDWALIDAGDVIIHIFRPEVRSFYDLEKMWLTPSENAKSAEPDNNAAG